MRTWCPHILSVASLTDWNSWPALNGLADIRKSDKTAWSSKPLDKTHWLWKSEFFVLRPVDYIMGVYLKILWLNGTTYSRLRGRIFELVLWSIVGTGREFVLEQDLLIRRWTGQSRTGRRVGTVFRVVWHPVWVLSKIHHRLSTRSLPHHHLQIHGEKLSWGFIEDHHHHCTELLVQVMKTGTGWADLKVLLDRITVESKSSGRSAVFSLGRENIN